MIESLGIPSQILNLLGGPSQNYDRFSGQGMIGIPKSLEIMIESPGIPSSFPVKMTSWIVIGLKL